MTMIRLAPGANPKNALQMITDAANKLTEVINGAALNQYNRYLEWASQQSNLLSYQLHPDELDHLVTTRRYWSLLPLDTSTVEQGTLAELVRGEVQQRTIALEAARKQIGSDQRRWIAGTAVAVVFDTNAWLKYFDDPMNHPEWLEVLNQQPDVPIVLTVPMKVVDELDGQKRNRADAPKGGRSIRMRAGLALKYIESRITIPGERPMLQEQILTSHPGRPQVYLTVLEQPLDRPQIPDADLEIIDRARSILSYAARVRIITTDSGMIYRAREAGLDAIRVRGYEEELKDQSAESARQSGR